MKKITDGMVNQCEYVLDNSCLLVERASEEGYEEGYKEGKADSIDKIKVIITAHLKLCETLGIQATAEWVLEMLEGLEDGEA